MVSMGSGLICKRASADTPAESQRSDSGVETKKQETKPPESQPQDVKSSSIL